MEKQELTTKQMLDAIIASNWEGKNVVNENSSPDAIRQAYYRMMYELEVKEFKKLDLLISDTQKRMERDSKKVLKKPKLAHIIK